MVIQVVKVHRIHMVVVTKIIIQNNLLPLRSSIIAIISNKHITNISNIQMRMPTIATIQETILEAHLIHHRLLRVKEKAEGIRHHLLLRLRRQQLLQQDL